MDQKPSICFVAHNAYGTLARVDRGHTGGIERQQSLMARWLAAHGYPVSMVTWDEGQPDGVILDGVRVVKMCRRNAGVRFVRFVHPAWTSLCAAFRRANANVYYYNCGDLGLGQLALWCRRHGRKCVYSVASDPDCDRRLPALKPWRERLLYRYGLQRADRVITQTRRQQRMLQQGFNIRGVVIPMPCEAPNGDGHSTTTPDGATARVLWVGRFSREKRLEWLLDLAERRSQWQFDIVGATNSAAAYSRALEQRAAALDNVTLHGRVIHARMSTFYRAASVLCCTSTYEGFPNTFLEAWSQGLPVVSTFDPDGLIANRGLGMVGTTTGELAAALEQVLGSPTQRRRFSENGKRYFLENHTADAVMRRFEAVFSELVADAAAG